MPAAEGPGPEPAAGRHDDGLGRPPPGPATAGGVRLRVRYSKLGRVRFTSHRDVVRMWERALRRSGLPVAWSEGFSPHPQISFGLALPTGAESVAEYLDVVLARPAVPGGPDVRGGAGARPEAALEEHLSRLLPAGIHVQAVATVPVGSSSLQHEVTSCSWKLEVLGLAAEELESRVERLLAAPSVLIERERKGRAVRDDLRPAVLAFGVSTPPGPPVVVDDVRRGSVWLDAELATRPRGVRPGELLKGLGDEVRLARACRMHQWIERDGARLEPLPVGSEAAGAVTAHVEGRAS